ncbi:MAG: ABC transporter substrate-binding protein [Candidatus Riflebacteria bacterium]|nr:ABC transporter substrate-binding protein [Candidatus Riflebacteria bacterium]
MKRAWFALALILIGSVVVGIAAGIPEKKNLKLGNAVFRGYLTSEPANLDPAKGVDVNEGIVQAKIFNGLLTYDENMKMVPDLAESWEVAEDGRTFNFHLRKDVRFHNGQPFSSKDVVFSFQRILAANTCSPRTWVFEKIVGSSEVMKGIASEVVGIKVLDDYNIQICLSEPFAPFLSLLTMPAAFILPSGSASEIADGAFFEKPSGTGPFMIISRERDSHIKLAAYDGYHGSKPYISGIEYRVIPESMKAEMEFESGNIDILQLNPTNYERFESRLENSGRVKDVPAMNVFYVGLNNQKPPFDDPKVRRALNYLINRESIINAVFKGRGKAAHGSIPPGILGYSDKLEGYGFNLKKGCELLKEAGFSPEHPLKFDLYQKSSQSAFEITRLVQGELKKAGVSVNLRSMEWSALKDAINKGEAEAFYLSWYGDYPDGENFLYPLFHSKNWGSGGNRSRYRNVKVDSMLDEALKIQDPLKRAEAYQQVDRAVVEEAPWIYLWHLNETYLLGGNLEKMPFSPMFAFDKGISIKMHE